MSGENPIIAGMAGRYATALFDLAKDQKNLDQVETELAQFAQALDDSDDLQRLVRSPVISAEAQGRAVAAVLDAAGIKGLSANFIGLIARNRRLFAVRDMISGFQALMAQHRGEVTAEVATATPLGEAQTDALSAVLKDSLGQDVRMETRVDPALLGGLVVKVGSRMIDNSLRTKLDNLKVAMKEVG